MSNNHLIFTARKFQPVSVKPSSLKYQLLTTRSSHIMKILVLALPILLLAFSCKPEEPTTPREEDGLVGQWQEIAEKSPLFDTAGILIDSIDISASYTFKDDKTYTCINDVWTDADSGSWEIDSTYSFPNLDIYPSYPTDPNSTRKDRWVITKLNSSKLEVEHYFKSTVNGSTTIVLFRKFKRI